MSTLHIFDMIGKCLTFFNLPLSIVTFFVRQVLLILARGFGYFRLFLHGNAVIQSLVLAPAIAIKKKSLLLIDYFRLFHLFHTAPTITVVIDQTTFGPLQIITVFFTHVWRRHPLFLNPATIIDSLRKYLCDFIKLTIVTYSLLLKCRLLQFSKYFAIRLSVDLVEASKRLLLFLAHHCIDLFERGSPSLLTTILNIPFADLFNWC